MLHLRGKYSVSSSLASIGMQSGERCYVASSSGIPMPISDAAAANYEESRWEDEPPPIPKLPLKVAFIVSLRQLLYSWMNTQIVM